MLKISKEKRIANKIKKILNKRGFIVKIKSSKKSKSVYLEIDNGACAGVRISNHINNKTKYKFNVIKNYRDKKLDLKNGRIKVYYNFKNIGRLISDIEVERSNKIINFGYSNYKRVRDKENVYSYFYYSKKVA